jgi:glutamine synthetase
MAGLAVACRYGFSLKDGVKVAESTYVNVNIHKKENEKLLNSLQTLPDSCAASADCLEKQREIYEQNGVFSPAMIDGILAQLRSFKDRTLRRDIQKKPAEVAKLVKAYFYCG